MSFGNTPPTEAVPPLELVVTTGGDVTDPNDGKTTLREALSEAEVAFQSGRSAVVSIDVDEPIKLTQGELVIEGTSVANGVGLTVEGGAGDGVATILRAGGDGARVLHIAGSAAAGDSQLVTLEGLILSGGEADIGGGLFAERAVLTLSDVTVDGNKALGAAGSTTVLGGGMALIDSQTTMTGGGITGNDAGQGAAAGSAPVLGGGVYVGRGTFAMTRAQVSGNELSTGDESTGGGGIAAVDAKLTLIGVGVADNEIAPAATAAQDGLARGAGIFLSGYAPGGSTVSYSSITGNSISQSSGTAFGGGMYVHNGAVTVEHSYLARNHVGGTASSEAVGGSAIVAYRSVLSVENSTIHANTLAGDDRNPPLGTILASGGSMALLGSTVVGNQSTAGSYTGIYPVATVPIVRNSIIANATSGDGTAPDVFGAIASNGHNLFTQSSVAGAIPGDLLGTDPELGAAADNGGPTLTMALLPGSPALDAGSDPDAIGKTDQRGTGFARISGGHTDIGAFETQQVGGIERLFTPGDDVVDLRGVDLDLLPGALGTHALAGNDTIRLSTTQNRGELFRAGRGDDVVIGGSAGDRIAGEAGDDRLVGGGRADVLRGGPGNDVLHGRRGLDELHGGAAADRFVYADASHAPHGTVQFDEIVDFSRREGDRIDLREIDARPGVAGDQHFAFVGRGPLEELGDLRVKALGDGNFLVSGQLDRDPSPEFSILVHTEDNLGHLERGDFLL